MNNPMTITKQANKWLKANGQPNARISYVKGTYHFTNKDIWGPSCQQVILQSSGVMTRYENETMAK